MIITLAGDEGSGKTTVGKILAKKLDYNFYSMGNLRGKIASEKGLTIDELNKIGESESWTDKEVDKYQEELGKKEDNFIMDGKLAWFFIPHSLKIFLSVDQFEGARRIFLNPRGDEKKMNTIKEMMDYVSQRRESDVKRYQQYYGANPYKKGNYDIYLDTTKMSIEEVADFFTKKIEELEK
jgi:CMP/dCMP kinase